MDLGKKRKKKDLNAAMTFFRDQEFKSTFKKKLFLSNALILSSDCSSGPKEIVGSHRGILFKSNSKEDFIEKFNKINLLSNKDKYKKILNAKKFVKKFTLLNHYKNFSKIIYD